MLPLGTYPHAFKLFSSNSRASVLNHSQTSHSNQPGFANLDPVGIILLPPIGLIEAHRAMRLILKSFCRIYL